jgi:hypothetical protein
MPRDYTETSPIPWGDLGLPEWGESRVYLIGGGSSLRGFDFERIRSRGISVGINQSMFDCDFCACGVSIDPVFVERKREQLEAFAEAKPLYLVLGKWWWHAIPKPIRGASYLADIERRGTSGFAALQIALRKGAKRITLLGFDYTPGHYHNEYAWSRINDEANKRSWPRWSKDFKKVDGVEITNASPGSLIECFPRLSLEEALALTD